MLVARKREDKLVRLYSKNFEEIGIIEFSVDELINIKEHDWANYPKGVVWAFSQEGFLYR